MSTQNCTKYCLICIHLTLFVNNASLRALLTIKTTDTDGTLSPLGIVDSILECNIFLIWPSSLLMIFSTLHCRGSTAHLPGILPSASAAVAMRDLSSSHYCIWRCKGAFFETSGDDVCECHGYLPCCRYKALRWCHNSDDAMSCWRPSLAAKEICAQPTFPANITHRSSAASRPPLMHADR
jgi:hypothetical protein